MSCGGGKPNFQLLDAYVGWPAYSAQGMRNPENLTGFDDPAGVKLELKRKSAVNPALVTSCLLPPYLAKGCGPCEWYLLTSCGPHSELLYRNACHGDWQNLWPAPQRPRIHKGAAIALWGNYLGLADSGAGLVVVFELQTGRVVASIPQSSPGPLAFTPDGELLIISSKSQSIARYGLDGRFRGNLPALLPVTINRLGVDGQKRIWVVSITPEKDWELWFAAWIASEFIPATTEKLREAFPETGLASDSERGFCFAQASPSGFSPSTCFDLCGKPLEPEQIEPAKPPRRFTQGQYLSTPLDSGVPRCRWHRIQLDADVPPSTSLEVAVASTDDLSLGQGNPDREPGWTSFAAGAPHPADWTTVSPGLLDALIDQPPGRYLYLRVRFTGDGRSTPTLRRIRLDFPRSTSLDRLPDVYREDPRAEDFTERFLALFDAAIGDVDSVIMRYPALLDPDNVPEQLLPWLAGFFDIQLDPTWDAAKRRSVLKAAPELYRLRGTPAGLVEAVEVIFGVKPVLEESSATGEWGAVGSRADICEVQKKCETPPPSVRVTARVGTTRLFGASRARFRVGRSALGAAPLRSYGDPSQDPFSVGAHRFQVVVPRLPSDSPGQRQRLVNLINSQKPAHTLASIRFGGVGFLVGVSSAVGIDSIFVPPAQPKLGRNGNIRLGRNSVLWRSAGKGKATQIGETTIVGSQIIAG